MMSEKPEIREPEPSIQSSRIKLVLIAYACEPHRGSEPGTGWNTALGLAKNHEVTVVTRANNRGTVDAALARMSPEMRPRFLYVDPPAWTLWLKSRGILPIHIFYLFWQRGVKRILQSGQESYDVIHQLTLNSFEVPPFAFDGVPGIKVWGPVGGGQTAPTGCLDAFGPEGARKEARRNRRVGLSARTPWVRRVLRSCDLVLFANSETRHLLQPWCRKNTGMMIDVGVDVQKFVPEVTMASGKGVTFLAAGRLEPRKGIVLAVEAFAAITVTHPDSCLRIVGDGPERPRLEAMIKVRGLEAKVVMTGPVSHEAMRHEFKTADVFLFPSLRDTSGTVVLEAMAMKLPIICFDHQGAALMVSENCGLRVSAHSSEGCVRGLQDAMERMAGDPMMRKRCGEAGRRAVIECYDWQRKTGQIENYYRKLISL